MKNLVTLVLKVVFLTVLLFIFHSVAGVVVGFSDASGGGVSGSVMISILLVCFLQSAVLSYFVVRSRFGGWRLVLTVFGVFYGIATVLSQMETVVFLRYLVSVVPAEAIPKLFLQGAIVAALFAPFVVLAHGKMKREAQAESALSIFPRSWGESLGKVVLIAVLYVVIYLAFGSLVFRPLAGKAFEEYYAGLSLPLWILPFQMGRGVLWLALALLVMGTMKGRWWEVRLAVALLFAVLMGSLLLLPNPYMPGGIRMAHLVEVTTSNFLFGYLLVWIWQYRPRRVR